jgi:hypothetical protein
MEIPVLVMGVTIIFWFYFSLTSYFRKWESSAGFRQKLFLHSLIYRIIAIIGVYCLTYFYDPYNLPMEIGAADGWNYHYSGELVSKTLKEGRNVFTALSGYWKNETDYGFSIYLGVVYYYLGPSIILIKLLNAVFGSITAIRVYQIATLIYSEKKARQAAILFMLFPPLLWFSAMYLKETILIFLIVNSSYYILKITHQPEKGIKFVGLLLVSLIPLYYFRLFLIPLIIIAAAIHFFFYFSVAKKNKFLIRFSFILISIGIFFVLRKFNMLEKIYELSNQGSTAFSNELTNSAIQRGVSYKQALIAPFILLGSIITPFPSLINFDENQFGIYMHYQNEIVRNAMYFFVFTGMYCALKNRARNMAYIFSFAVGYIMILALSGVSFQDRFQLLGLPFLIFFIPIGLDWQHKKKLKFWEIYLFVITIAILSWNIFKLSIRGLV